MIPVISLLDLKHRTYIPNLISNYSFYCKQITNVHEISSDVPLAGVSTCHSQWTLNNAVNYENKQAPQHKESGSGFGHSLCSLCCRHHNVGHGGDETKWSKEKNKSVSIS